MYGLCGLGVHGHLKPVGWVPKNKLEKYYQIVHLFTHITLTVVLTSRASRRASSPGFPSARTNKLCTQTKCIGQILLQAI